MSAVSPAPAVAVALATSAALVVNAGGDVVPAPGAIVHVANARPQLNEGGVVEPRLSVALAVLPVLVPPTNRFWEFLRNS